MASKPRPLYIPSAPENQYPKMIYPTQPPKPGTGKLVNNKEEHDALLASLVPPTPKLEDRPVVTTLREEKTETPVADEKEALLKQASDLGIPADKRWSVQRIKDAIAEKQKAA